MAAIFCHGGIQFRTFALFALLCQISFCQTIPLLPSVVQHKKVLGYWWEGSTSTLIPPSTSDVVKQYNRIKGVTSGAALI